MTNTMPAKKPPGLIDFECGQCSKRISMSGDERNVHPAGWKLITKESDHSQESFHLCPECYSRYKSGNKQ